MAQPKSHITDVGAGNQTHLGALSGNASREPRWLTGCPPPRTRASPHHGRPSERAIAHARAPPTTCRLGGSTAASPSGQTRGAPHGGLSRAAPSPQRRPAVPLHTSPRRLASHPFPCQPSGLTARPPPRARLAAWVPGPVRRRLFPALAFRRNSSALSLPEKVRLSASERSGDEGAGAPQPPGSNPCSPN